LTEAQIIDPLILTKERRREIPIVGDPDEITLARVKVYYNTIATLVEKKTQTHGSFLLSNITHEGFGRAFVLTGKLIVVDKILRDVHRLGFPSLEELCVKTEEVVEKAAALIDNTVKSQKPRIWRNCKNDWRKLKKLEKDVKKNKRLASEQAMELHDLIEDRCLTLTTKLMGIAQATFDACKAWDEANKKFLAASGAWGGKDEWI